MNTEPCVARESVNRLSSRLAREKQELVLFLIELADFDRGKLGLELGYPSTLGCLVGELGLTESSACRRIGAARLLARFPAIAPYLVANRLTLMGLMALKDVLDEANVDALLARAAGLSEPALRELVTRLRVDAARPAPAEPAEVASFTSTVAATPDATPPGPPLQLTAAPADDRSALTLWVGREFREQLTAVRDLVSHAVPSGKAEDVLLYALRELRKRHETRRYGSKRKPAPAAAADSASRYVPASVRRKVAEREPHSCAFVGAEGRRCGSTWRLELQHVQPHAQGGPTVAANLTYYCRAHNLLQAERDFGAETIAARARARATSPHAADVLSALTNLGFTKKQAAAAVTRAAERAPGSSLETLLRESLRLLRPPDLVGHPT